MIKTARTMTIFILLLFVECSMPAEKNGTSNTEAGQFDFTDISGPSAPATEESSQTKTYDNQKSNILIAYFSRTGENYGVGHIEKEIQVLSPI